MTTKLAEAMQIFLRWWKPPPLTHFTSVASRVVEPASVVTPVPPLGTESMVSTFTPTVASKGALQMLPTAPPAFRMASPAFSVVHETRIITVVTQNKLPNTTSGSGVVDGTFDKAYNFFLNLFNALIAWFSVSVNGLRGFLAEVGNLIDWYCLRIDLTYVLFLLVCLVVLVLFATSIWRKLRQRQTVAPLMNPHGRSRGIFRLGFALDILFVVALVLGPLIAAVTYDLLVPAAYQAIQPMGSWNMLVYTMLGATNVSRNSDRLWYLSRRCVAWLDRWGYHYCIRFAQGVAPIILLLIGIMASFVAWALDSCIDWVFDKVCKLVDRYQQPWQKLAEAQQKLAKAQEDAEKDQKDASEAQRTIERLKRECQEAQTAKDKVMGRLEELEVYAARTAPSRQKLQADYEREKQSLDMDLKRAKAAGKKQLRQQDELIEQEWARKDQLHARKHKHWLSYQEDEIRELETELKDKKASFERQLEELRNQLRLAGMEILPDGSLPEGLTLWDQQLVRKIKSAYQRERNTLAKLEDCKRELEQETTSRTQAEARATTAEGRAAHFQKQLKAAKAQSKLEHLKVDTKTSEELKALKEAHAQLEKSSHELQKKCTRQEQRCADLEKAKAVLSDQKSDSDSKAAKLVVDKDELAKENANLKATNANLSKENLEISEDRKKLKETVKALEAKATWEKTKPAKFQKAFPNGAEVIDVGSDRFLCAMAAISTSMQNQNIEGIHATVAELVECYEKHRVQAKLPDSKDNPMLTVEQLDKFFCCWSKDMGKKALLGIAIDAGEKRRILTVRAHEDDTTKILWIYKKTGAFSDVGAYRKLAEAVCWQALAPKKEAPKGDGDKPDAGDDQKRDTQQARGDSQPPSSQQPTGDNKTPKGDMSSGDGKPADTNGPSGDDSESEDDAL
ncbi:MAG: hypothetical protein Q9184_005953 [Pyrenodesmia sp. 2 TL-2023]